MTTSIALFGAGRKMGVHLSRNLMGSAYRVRHVKPGAAGRQRLKDELGPPDAFALGEDIAKIIYAPAARSCNVTVEQMAVLEPGLSETVCATLLDVMRDDCKKVFERDEIAESIRRIT